MVGSAAVSVDDLAGLEFFASCPRESLGQLAQELRPLSAAPGQVLMRQGEHAVSFLLIGSGHAEVTHTGLDGDTIDVEVGAGLIVGEIALLRDATRNATVTARDHLIGWVGGREAFASMLDVACLEDRLLRTARQRLAAYIKPIPFTSRRHRSCTCARCCPATARVGHGPVEFSSETLYRRFKTTRTPTRSLMTYLFEVDYVDHFVWVVIDGRGGPSSPTPDSCVSSPTRRSPRSHSSSATTIRAAASAPS